MKKYLLPLLLVIFSVFFGNYSQVLSSSKLELSQNSSFSSLTDKFSSGQTIYARVESDSEGDKKRELNLRDDKYNLITTYSLSKNGNVFSTSLSAPQNSGYYSLEAKIESAGSVSTSVKTIKVDNPTNSSVRVNINSSVRGSTTSERPSPSPLTVSPSPSMLSSAQPTPIPSPSEEPAQEVSPKTNPFVLLGSLLARLITFFWPF